MTEKILKLPKFPKKEEYTTESFLDNTQIENLDKALISALLKLREISKKLDDYSRKKVERETIYKHKYRKFLLSAEGKTESQKKLLAEIACEEEEIAVAYLDEVIKELTRYSYNLKTEIDVIKTLGNNARTELRL